MVIFNLAVRKKWLGRESVTNYTPTPSGFLPSTRGRLSGERGRGGREPCRPKKVALLSMSSDSDYYPN